MFYHIWKLNQRKNGAFIVTRKRKNRWDDSDVPAVWKSQAAARDYGNREGWDFMVIKCEGPSECGGRH